MGDVLKSFAEQILDNPAYEKICNHLSQDAIEKGINAAPTDDETRRVSAYEVRAIRSFDRKLKSLAKGAKTSPVEKQAIA